MKERVSITIDEEVNIKIDKLLKDKRFRNKSHVFEIAIEKFLKEVNK